jgi:hypothetical protein
MTGGQRKRINGADGLIGNGAVLTTKTPRHEEKRMRMNFSHEFHEFSPMTKFIPVDSCEIRVTQAKAH